MLHGENWKRTGLTFNQLVPLIAEWDRRLSAVPLESPFLCAYRLIIVQLQAVWSGAKRESHVCLFECKDLYQNK